jgi:FRG domain.
MAKKNIPRMPESFEALNRLFQQVIQVREALKREDIWWRGQPKRGLLLQPKIYRNRHSDDVFKEYNLIHNFNRQAPLRYPTWPAERCLQLILMRHYGLPTRLLDWSQGLLTALYFAVCSENLPDEPASLWALNPHELTKIQFPDSFITIFHHNTSEVKKIVDAAFDNIHHGGRHVIAMSTPEVDLRMFVQWSVFTIHESGMDMEELQNELKGDFLKEIIIQAEDRCLLRQALEIVGISRSRLFPDLQQLAEDLESKIN